MVNHQDIFSISTNEEFNKLALDVFKFQFENNPVYRSFCDLLYKHPSEVKSYESIPFLPIEFFKTHTILSNDKIAEKTFSSSGTTGSLLSKHFITDLHLYETSFLRSFKEFYGNIEEYTILALLPSYLEREGSSLIYMVNELIKHSNKEESGFYINNLSELRDTIQELESNGRKTLLIGVSFALLDLIEKHQLQLKHTMVMETGGMKGKRKELIRHELHSLLKTGFGVKTIHSEYGMTELLSQAYSKSDGIFNCPKWMKVLTRDTEDSLTLIKDSKTGGINIIDLANINSCSFIATQDLGKVYPDDSFEILGRFDTSDIRGCNLMAL